MTSSPDSALNRRCHPPPTPRWIQLLGQHHHPPRTPRRIRPLARPRRPAATRLQIRPPAQPRCPAATRLQIRPPAQPQRPAPTRLQIRPPPQPRRPQRTQQFSQPRPPALIPLQNLPHCRRQHPQLTTGPFVQQEHGHQKSLRPMASATALVYLPVTYAAHPAVRSVGPKIANWPLARFTRTDIDAASAATLSAVLSLTERVAQRTPMVHRISRGAAATQGYARIPTRLVAKSRRSPKVTVASRSISLRVILNETSMVMIKKWKNCLGAGWLVDYGGTCCLAASAASSIRRLSSSNCWRLASSCFACSSRSRFICSWRRNSWSFRRRSL